MDYIGQVVNNYRIVKELGKGGFGQVYFAEHIYLPDRKAALKFLLETITDPREKKRFEEEAQKHAKLSHPNIVPLLDFGVHVGTKTPYLITKYMPGDTLYHYLDQQLPLPIRATKILIQIGEALQYAHQRGIIHRDLTPGNIFFDDQGNALLGDFGIAEEIGNQTSVLVTSKLGKTGYAAPEYIGKGQASIKSDQFSLGCVAYEMLVGYTPDYKAIIRGLLPSPRNLNPQIPEYISQAVMRTLERDPNNRYPVVQNFVSALQKGSLQSPTLLPPTQPAFPSPTSLPPTQPASPSPTPLPPTQPASPSPAPQIPTIQAQKQGGVPIFSPALPAPTPKAAINSTQRSLQRLAIFVGILLLLGLLALAIFPQWHSSNPTTSTSQNSASSFNGTITEFPVSTGGNGITEGPDGNLWVMGFDDQVEQITPQGVSAELPLPSEDNGNGNLVDITTGADNNLWFTEFYGKIGRMTTSGQITEFPVPGIQYPSNGLTVITRGANGTLWFGETGTNQIGRITLTGVITQFPIPDGSNTRGITLGPDGNIWFTEEDTGEIGRITPGGTVTMFSIPASGSGPSGITTGPDGDLWFADIGANQIGRITPIGAITMFPVPTSGSEPTDIVAGPDGNLWFTESSGNQIGRITPGGVISEFPVPTVDSSPVYITSGPDSTLWFTEFHERQVGKISF